MATMRQICEYIEKANFLVRQDGSPVTANEIFNSSPTGELFQVFQWYEMAKLVLGDGGVQES